MQNYNIAMENNLAEIKDLYNDLIGRLSHIPLAKEIYDSSNDLEILDEVDQTIDLLCKATGSDYDRYKTKRTYRSGGSGYLPRTSYKVVSLRGNIQALINILHDKYFITEDVPFSGKPQTKIDISQTQAQSQQQSLNLTLLEAQEKIINLLNKPDKLKVEEKTFLENLKQKLPTITTMLELLNVVLELGIKFNFSSEKLMMLFKMIFPTS